MAQVKIKSGERNILIFEGGETLTYPVKDGVTDVDDAHVAAVLAAVPGSELVPEPPAKEK